MIQGTTTSCLKVPISKFSLDVHYADRFYDFEAVWANE